MPKPGPNPPLYNFYCTTAHTNGQDPSVLIVTLKAIVDVASGTPLFTPGAAFNLSNATLTADKIAKPNPPLPNVLGLGIN